MVDRDPAPDFVRAGGTGADVLGAGSAQVIPLPGRERQSRSVAELHDAEVLAMPAVRKARIEPEPDPLTRALEFVHNRLTGNYDVDEFGFDEELTESLVLPVLRVLYDKWFRETTYGDENLPADGGAQILVAARGHPEPLRSEEHTSELQSRENIVCRLLLEKKKKEQE